MILPTLSEAQIRQNTSAESFARGASYYQSGAVSALVLRDGLLQAEVEGTQYEPYRVAVRLDEGGIRTASCSCPYDWGGWCKHIVATLLAYAHAGPGGVQIRPALTELLADLDRDQLADLLLRLAAHDPLLVDQIDSLIAPTQPVTISPTITAPISVRPVASSQVAPTTSPLRRTTVDVAPFRQQIQRIFRGQRYDDYMAYTSILAELEPLVAQIRSFLAGNDTQNALLLLEALTDSYSEAWVDYDDSDGELGVFFEDLGALWAEALLAANPKQAELKRWRSRMEDWSAAAEEYGCDGLNIALQAVEEGWSHPWVDAAILGEARPDSRPNDAYTSELLAIRFQILERSGHFDEALNLAAAAGMHRERALLLLRLDRANEAIELGQQHFHKPDEVLTLAQALRERGDFANALTVGECGLSMEVDTGNIYGQQLSQARLAAWVSDLAAGQERIELALRAGIQALQVEPELGLYLRLAEMAGSDWPTLREQLLADLRASTSWRAAGRIDIFLHEGQIDDAIAALGAHPDGAELARVMDAAIPTRPDWVIKAASASAEGIINPGSAKYYASAVEWLRRARAAYQAAGRPNDWTSYIHGLRAKHGRKHKLMDLLNQLERTRR